MIKLAMVSFWHVHARDYARQADEHPDTEIVAVWMRTRNGWEKRLHIPILDL